jgi:cytosine/adenosine deaminase-related metal-dependent hydrolase
MEPEQRLVFRRVTLWARPGERGAQYSVAVEGDRISAIDVEDLPRRPGDWQIDGEGRLLLPGFVDGHTHLHRRLARGLTAGPIFPRGYPQLEEPLRSRYERVLTHEDLRAAVRLAAAEAALSGTTGLFDLLRAPACAEGSLSVAAQALKEVGLRGALAYGASDRDGAVSVGIQECVRFCEEARRSNLEESAASPSELPRRPLIVGMAGLSHPDALGSATLDALQELVSLHGLHFHALETEAELALGYQLHGRRTVERMADFGLLGVRTLAAHNNQINLPETRLLADASATCAFTPRASMLSEERPPRLEAALEAGVQTVLGTDGLGLQLKGEWPWVLALWRRNARPDAQHGYHALDRLWLGAHRLQSRVFSGSGFGPGGGGPSAAGRLSVGDPADLVLVEHHAGVPFTPESLPAQVALSLAEAAVAWTVVGGRVLVREGELLTLDVREAEAHARERAEALWKRL